MILDAQTTNLRAGPADGIGAEGQAPLLATVSRQAWRRIDPDTRNDPAIEAWLEQVRAGAVARERERVLPHRELREFARLGLGAVRLPVNEGGQGWSIAQLLAFARRIAAADANVAHALRNHFLFVEVILTFAPGEKRSRWLALLAGGGLLGDANSEREGSIAKGGGSRLRRVPGGYRLTGSKFYSTGCIYADWLFVTAYDEADVLHWIMVPAQAEGVSLVDDWDGFGQRLTGSGTTRFEDVLVPEADILVEDLVHDASRPRQGAFAQLYLTTAVAGVLDNVLADAVALLRQRSRNFPHGSAVEASEDPLLQEQIGYLSAWAFAGGAAVGTAAQALDEARGVFLAHLPFVDAYEQASLAAAQAKLVVDELATRAATLLFDVGGASATSIALGLDRHWRNARTIASHNPRPFKARGIGDHLVNGTSLPRFFF